MRVLTNSCLLAWQMITFSTLCIQVQYKYQLQATTVIKAVYFNLKIIFSLRNCLCISQQRNGKYIEIYRIERLNYAKPTTIIFVLFTTLQCGYSNL